MLAMHGVEFFILAFIAAAASVVYGGGFPKSLLTLERAFPASQHVELGVLRARDRSRHAGILQGVVSGVVNFSLLGKSDQFLGGLYFTGVKLGSPPKEFSVQIDTGSDILWVTCNSCNNCPKSSDLGIKLDFFDPACSATASLVSCSDPICASIIQTAAAECSAQSNQCGYSFQYKDGSGTSGFYVSDFLYFDTIMGPSLVTNSSAPIVFGTNQSGDLIMPDKASDGIFGFGRQDLSVISQLSSRGITPKLPLPKYPNSSILVVSITAAVSQFATPIISKGNRCYRVPISITEIFPSVAFNFAGGASMVLRPVDYLVHDGLV
ncbi:Aspartic proteinase-like protein 2 [Camellia lanceoleosa]|uniref:Aspartic proteinase-like protein 2 n=1 Tax=Camellia lanceoleosa TaxID=1840588 RepID=A0ACC0GED0_9ERIC|nr:Aspartic proteinase-like protein 2 [Camellia lanceoleosa]